VRRRIALAIVAVVVVGWNAALWAAPAAAVKPLAAMTYLAGSLVCHQQPARSFHQNGVQYPVCARCQGLYGGAVLGVAGWLMLTGMGAVGRSHEHRFLKSTTLRTVLLIVALPTLASLALAWLNVWDASNAWRAALAVPLGAAIAMVLAAVAARDLR
jgi:uncharacterized membrane protein